MVAKVCFFSQMVFCFCDNYVAYSNGPKQKREYLKAIHNFNLKSVFLSSKIQNNQR